MSLHRTRAGLYPESLLYDKVSLPALEIKTCPFFHCGLCLFATYHRIRGRWLFCVMDYSIRIVFLKDRFKKLIALNAGVITNISFNSKERALSSSLISSSYSFSPGFAPISIFNSDNVCLNYIKGIIF